MAGNRQNNLRVKFSALNVDFNYPSSDSLGSRRPAQSGVKYGYPFSLKVVILPLWRENSCRWAQIHCTCILLIRTSTGDEFLIVVNIDDLE